MSDRKSLDRDGLEFYLLNLLLAYRPILQIGGGLILVYAIAAFLSYPPGSIVALILSTFFFLMFFSYSLTLHVAKFGAWLGTLRERD